MDSFSCPVYGRVLRSGGKNIQGNLDLLVRYTVRDGKVYKGTSQYTSDILLTIRDGRIYRGTSTYSKDILATIRDGKVYAGTSQYTSDIRFTFDGPLLLEEFVAVWFAVMYVW